MKSDNTQEEYDLAKAEYNRKAAEIDHRVDKMYRDVFMDTPYLLPVLGISGLVIVLVVGWLLIESSSSRRALNDLAETDPELVKKLTGYNAPKRKIIDIHRVQEEDLLPKEESPDLLPKD